MRIALLVWLFALLFSFGSIQAPDAQAQGWSGGSYQFPSDLERRQKQREAAREKRRKQYAPTRYPRFMKGGERPNITPEAPEIVYLNRDEAPGTIIVATNERKLYYVLPGRRAYSYPISVGRTGFTWTGTERISRIKAWPSWTPPSDMRRRQPGLPITVSGGLINPLGAKALYLGNSIYRIHGTNNKRSIGRASSSGCFRMLNKHVVHLATLAKIGTKVLVMRSYSGVSSTMPLSMLFGGFSAAEEPPKKAKKPKRRYRKKKKN